MPRASPSAKAEPPAARIEAATKRVRAAVDQKCKWPASQRRPARAESKTGLSNSLELLRSRVRGRSRFPSGSPVRTQTESIQADGLAGGASEYPQVLILHWISGVTMIWQAIRSCSAACQNRRNPVIRPTAAGNRSVRRSCRNGRWIAISLADFELAVAKPPKPQAQTVLHRHCAPSRKLTAYCQ